MPKLIHTNLNIQTAGKVEKILKGSLDSILSPSSQRKFKLWAGKFSWVVKAKHQCFALLPQVNFPANNLNFLWRLRWIQAIFLNLFYFTSFLQDTVSNSKTRTWFFFTKCIGVFNKSKRVPIYFHETRFFTHLRAKNYFDQIKTNFWLLHMNTYIFPV